MYREKLYQRNGFHSHQDFVETVCWLREQGMTLGSIASLYQTTRQYIRKLCLNIEQPIVVNRKNKSQLPRRRSNV